LVSVDFNHNPASSTYDETLTKVSGRLVKVTSRYDDEWGVSNRMLDTTVALMHAKGYATGDGQRAIQAAHRAGPRRQAGLHPGRPQRPAGRCGPDHRRHPDPGVRPGDPALPRRGRRRDGYVPSRSAEGRRPQARGVPGAGCPAALRAARRPGPA